MYINSLKRLSFVLIASFISSLFVGNVFGQSAVGNPENNDMPQGMYAGMFFGTSALNLKFDGSPIQISQINYSGTRPDSIVPVPDDIEATVSPDAKNQSLNLDAGFWLGYFPRFSTFNLGENAKLGLGAMTQLGLSFNGGFGGWLGIGPEAMYISGPFSLNLGYGIGWTGQQRKLGKLQLNGADYIVIENNKTEPGPNGGLIDVPCTIEDYKSETLFCRMCDEETDFVAKSSAITQSFYARIGYAFGQEKKTGINLVVGFRQERSASLNYELWGAYEKGIRGEQHELPGPEMQGLGNSFSFSGAFFQIELFTRPF